MPGPPGKQLGLNHWPWASGLGPTERPPFSGVINKEGVLKQTEGTQWGRLEEGQWVAGWAVHMNGAPEEVARE